jgi:hypothetical protein
VNYSRPGSDQPRQQLNAASKNAVPSRRRPPHQPKSGPADLPPHWAAPKNSDALAADTPPVGQNARRIRPSSLQHPQATCLHWGKLQRHQAVSLRSHDLAASGSAAVAAPCHAGLPDGVVCNLAHKKRAPAMALAWRPMRCARYLRFHHFRHVAGNGLDVTAACGVRNVTSSMRIPPVTSARAAAPPGPHQPARSPESGACMT